MYIAPSVRNAEEAKWRRREDARILAQAEEIKADKERLREAHKGAQEILEEEASRLRGLSKIASNTTAGETVKQVVKKVEKNTRKKEFNNPATKGWF